MIVKKTEFVRSAADRGSMLHSDLPQIAIVGKSNVGKSSFLNMIANDSKMARTSKDPGRTRLINYFLVNEAFFFTDLPGYGYAKVSNAEKRKWATLIEGYLENEPNLVHVLFLVDARHDPTADDCLMYRYLFERNLPFTLIATKTDKLPKSQVKNQLRHLASLLKLGEDNVIGTSAVTRAGKDAVLQRLEQILQVWESSTNEE